MADLQVLDRITVAIPSTQNVKNATDHFTVYHVEITIHGVPIETWSVSKRYKEFLELNDELCKKYEVVKGFSFPKKTVVGKMKPETIEKRRKKLEQFIQKLLTTQLENDFLVRQFLALNNRGISILNRSHEGASPPASKRDTYVEVNLDPNTPNKDSNHQSPKDSHAALAASNYEIEENNADHSEIITSASQSLSSSSDLSPHTSQMFARGQTPPPVATFINPSGNGSPSPVTIVAEEDTRGSVSHGVPTPVPTSTTPKSPSGHTFGSLKNSLVPGEDNLVIEGLGLNAAIVGERAEISIRSALSGNIADRLWGELVQADSQVPLIVEPVGEGQYLASYIPFKSGTGTLNIFYLAGDGNKQPLITSQTVSIMVAPAYPSRSLAVGDAITSPFYVGVTSCFIINSMDRLGNPVKFGGAQIRTTLKPITAIDSSIDTEKLVSVHVQDRNDGTYVVGVTPRAEGKYEMHVLLNGYDVKESPFKICVLAETEPHENNPECCPQHLEDELKIAEEVPARSALPINTTDAQLHEELKEALSSSPDLQVDYSKLPPTTPRDNVINS